MSYVVALLTNNPLFHAAAETDADLRSRLVFTDAPAQSVVVLARDRIHQGWRLLNHPLYGNFRPGHQPFRSLLLAAPSPVAGSTTAPLTASSSEAASLVAPGSVPAASPFAAPVGVSEGAPGAASASAASSTASTSPTSSATATTSTTSSAASPATMTIPVDQESLHLIEEALGVYAACAGSWALPHTVSPVLARDCALLDRELLRETLERYGCPCPAWK